LQILVTQSQAHVSTPAQQTFISAKHQIQPHRLSLNHYLICVTVIHRPMEASRSFQSAEGVDFFMCTKATSMKICNILQSNLLD